MDEALLLWINQGWANPVFDAFFTWISERAAFSTPLLFLLLAASIWRFGIDGLRFWGLLILTVGLGDLMGNLLKQWFADPRPCYDLFEQVRMPYRPSAFQCEAPETGLPSNHALNFFAAAVFSWVALNGRYWSKPLLIIAVLVGISRVYLGKHYPHQVLVGGVIGAAWGFAAAWFSMRLFRFMRFIHQPPWENAALQQTVDTPNNVFEDALVKYPHRLSIVVPLFNEEECVMPLAERIHQALADYPQPWELILIDDGSSDMTANRMEHGAATFGSHVRCVHLQRNFGQTAAMQAGIDQARGDVIITMDGDLQNDPIDIPRLVGRLLEEDLDLVAGWRKNRKDGLWMRKIPSMLANLLIGRITQVQLHDYGCSLKAYRASVMRRVRLYGDMHRFIPAWIATHTSPTRIKEEAVTHHAREFGTSKYGIGRTFRVIVDLLSVFFFMRYLSRPGHFFGRIGLGFCGLGGLGMAWLFIVKFGMGEDIGDRPLLMLSILLVVIGVQFLTTGVLSEILSRTYYESGERRPYVIRNEHQLADQTGWKESN